jgi:hypothetical protein
VPWQASDVERHNKGLSQGKKKQWASVANSILKKTGDEGKAVRIANGVVSKEAVKRRIERGSNSGR